MRIAANALNGAVLGALSLFTHTSAAHDQAGPPTADPQTAHVRTAVVRDAHRGSLDRYRCHHDGSSYHCH